MTRQEYINYRVKNQEIWIVYNYFRLKSGREVEYSQFVRELEAYINMVFHKSLESGNPISKNNIFNSIVGICIEYYDAEFTIIYIEVEEEIKVKKTIKTLIL